MEIKEGYWNYYMSFQVRSYAEVLKCMIDGNHSDFIIAIYADEQILVSNCYEQVEDEHLELYIQEMVPVLEKTGEAISDVHGKEANQKSTISLMCPLEMTLKNGKEILCPVFMFLLNSGLGVLKLRVPINDLPADCFQKMPLKKWYDDVSVVQEEDKQLKRLKVEKIDETVNDIVALMQHVIKRSFDGHLIAENRNLCFESILLSKTIDPNILNSSFKQDELRDIYHMCNPENFIEFPSNSKVNEFWRDKHKNIGGIDFIIGVPGRVVIFSDANKLLKVHNRTECENTLEYLENSMQFSYDWPICLGLWKKLNEMNLFSASEMNYHKVNYNNAVFNLRENELDAMLDLCPYNCKLVFQMVFDILDISLTNFSDRVERLMKLEAYIKGRLDERRNLIFELIAFVITAIFGLPAIVDTISILKNAFLEPDVDTFKYVSVNGVAICIWIVFILIVGYRLVKNTIQYRNYNL